MLAAAKYATFQELKSTERLPSPTGVALSILEMVDRDNTTASDIASRLQADPALTGRIIKLSNSAQQGRATRFSNVRDAVSFLGLRQVRNVALGISLVTKYAAGTCAAFRYHEFWSRSLATAVAAQAVATRLYPKLASDAFTAGLLLDIGQLALATVYPDDYSRVLLLAQKDPATDLRDLEEEHCAVGHDELTCLMLADWRLPAFTVEGIRRHADLGDLDRDPPAPAGAAHLARVLHLATQFGVVCVAPADARWDAVQELLSRGAKLGFQNQDLLALGDALVREWLDWSKLLSLPCEELPPFATLADRLASFAAAEAPLDGGTGRFHGRLIILVAETDRSARQVLCEQLLQANHSVLRAEDGRRALHLALEEQPHLMLADVGLPELDGLALCRALRQSKAGQRMRIVLLGRREGDEDMLRAIAAGADDYLIKPVRPRLLEARLLALERLVLFGMELEREREENRRIAAELAIANGKLHQAAFSDALTDLPNRRFGWNRLETEWRGDNQQPLSCLLLDVDHFKRVNDTHGHDAGDAVLKHIASVLRDQTRHGEMVCRWGGEEFFLLCPATPLKGALVAAERLRAAVHSSRTNFAGQSFASTVSIGVAERVPSMANPDEFLKAADEAVYVAKQQGRNRVCAANRSRQ